MSKVDENVKETECNEEVEETKEEKDVTEESEVEEKVENEEQEDSCEEQGEETAVKIAALEEEKEKLIERLSRLQADFNNYRRRVKEEKKDIRARANENLLLELLPIIDNFERAIEANEDEGANFSKGVGMIYKQLMNLLNKEEVTPMESMGEEFDPELHHAVMKEPADDVEEDTIIQVMQKGYYYKDRVLRPAMVKVAE